MLPSYHFCTIQNHHNDQKLQQINSSSTTTTNTKAQQANAVSTLHISNTSTVVHDYLQLNKGKRTVSLVHNSACINNGTVQSTKSALIKLEQKHAADVYKHCQQTLCYPKTQSTFLLPAFQLLLYRIILQYILYFYPHVSQTCYLLLIAILYKKSQTLFKNS